MRMHRITLLVSKAEKERIAREAAFLGTSTGDYVRKAAMLLDAEDIVGMEDVRSLLPELRAALDRIHDNLTAAAEHSEKHQREIARMRTPEYRDEVRRSITDAEVEAVASLLGFERPEGGPLNEMARASSRVAEPRAPWPTGNEDGTKPE